MIRLAETATDIAACFPVMVQLRSHLHADTFVARIQALGTQGYQLAFLEDLGVVVSVAGFKLDHNLYAGKHLYVEDLVTCEKMRGKGYGEQMMHWLKAYAKTHQCQVLHLDSGVQRFAAHRFYLKQHLDIVSHHFLIRLDG